MIQENLKPGTFPRRALIKKAASIGAISALGFKASVHEEKPAATKLKKGAVILFQGDSITDQGRDKKETEANNTPGLGKGYPSMAAGLLHADYPEHELKIYNRGISGNKVLDLAARWQADVIDLTFVLFQKKFEPLRKTVSEKFWGMASTLHVPAMHSWHRLGGKLWGFSAYP